MLSWCNRLMCTRHICGYRCQETAQASNLNFWPLIIKEHQDKHTHTHTLVNWLICSSSLNKRTQLFRFALQNRLISMPMMQKLLIAFKYVSSMSPTLKELKCVCVCVALQSITEITLAWESALRQETAVYHLLTHFHWTEKHSRYTIRRGR